MNHRQALPMIGLGSDKHRFTIRDGDSTALQTAYTVDTVDMVYTIDTVYTIQSALPCLNSSMYALNIGQKG